MGPPLEPNNIIFLKQGINYSASRASENGMWDHSATPQDVCTSVSMLKGPVAQNFRNGDAYRRHFLRGLSGLNLASLPQSLAFAPALDVKIDAAYPYRRHFLRGLSGLNLASLPQSLAFAPALDVKIDAAYPRHFLKGLSSLNLLNLASVSQSLAFALALDVKIDAAPFQKFDPLSQTRYFVQMATP